MNIYGVYDQGLLIAKGNAKELAKKYYTSSSAIYVSERKNKLLDGKYEVRLIDVSNPKIVTEQTIIKLTGFDQRVDDVIDRLKRYGNTVLPTGRQKEAEKYVNELKARGYDVRMDRYMQTYTEHLLVDITRPRRGKMEYDFIVTLG